jgi:EAL domain-containing protein (putative c-di-GMP-specific phosphodiesterase class I)
MRALTPEQLRVLRRLGCELGQGHLFSRPAPGPELERFLLAGVEMRATA